MHVLSFYGFTNSARDRKARENNERLIDLILQYIGQLGQVPICLLGDFNAPTSASFHLSRALAEGQLVDIEQQHADLRGCETVNTCHQKETSEGSRIDLFLGNHVVAASVLHAEVIAKEQTGLPTHALVTAQLDLQSFKQQLRAFRKPRVIPKWTPDPDKDAEDNLTMHALQASMVSEEAWAQVLQAESIDDVFRIFSEQAERFLWLRHAGDASLPASHKGRGGRMATHTVQMTAPHQGPQGALDIRSVRLGKLTRRCEELVRKLTLRSFLAPVPAEWFSMWRQCRQDGFELLPGWAQWTAEENIPDLGRLRDISAALRLQLQAETTHTKTRRAGAWANVE